MATKYSTARPAKLRKAIAKAIAYDVATALRLVLARADIHIDSEASITASNTTNPIAMATSPKVVPPNSSGRARIGRMATMRITK